MKCHRCGTKLQEEIRNDDGSWSGIKIYEHYEYLGASYCVSCWESEVRDRRHVERHHVDVRTEKSDEEAS